VAGVLERTLPDEKIARARANAAPERREQIDNMLETVGGGGAE
jgi:hypothetical protein